MNYTNLYNRSRILIIVFLFACHLLHAQKFPGLASTPPMGWNSWNTFQTNISDKLVREIADKMVASGMKEKGYTYLVLDDGWMAMNRDSITGDLIPDPQKFPSGMRTLIDYVHSKGLKFGLYNCAGTKTCAGYPGTRGYEYQDARLYASLQIDYLKFDWCNTEGINAKEAYSTMSNALKKAGRPMIFSLCEWGDNKPWLWATNIGHLWRTTGDISNQFEGKKDYGTWAANGVMTIVDMQDTLRKYAGPGHWNDPDMLEVGNGLTESENRAHFALWCMLAAPLITGNDLRSMSVTTSNILTNHEVVAIDQDVLGIQGFRYSAKDSIETWMKPLSNGAWAVCFLNRRSKPATINYDWKKESITDPLSKNILSANIDYKIRNVWTKADVGTTKKPLKATVGSHDVLLFVLTSSMGNRSPAAKAFSDGTQ